MFLSAQYAVYASAHPITDANPRAEIRILPKSLYGKNAPASTVPHSFFSHFYGSSWHDDDAGFLLFLGVWGKKLMYVAAVVIVLGIMRLAYLKWSSNSLRQYQVLSILPTTASTSGTPSGLTSPAESTGSTEFPPAFEQVSIPNHIPSDLASAFKRAGDVIFAAPVTLLSTDHRRRARRRTGLLYFVPALFQAGPSSEQRSPRVSMTSPPSIRMARRDRDCDRDSVLPPPYDDPPWVGLGEMADGVASSRDTEETSSSTDGASDVMLREAELVEWEKDARQ